MKIQNDVIMIRSGKKRLELRNMILDTYLKQFANAQVSNTNAHLTENKKLLNFCLLKFDETLDFSTDSEIANEKFDICLIEGSSIIQTGNDTQINITYDYMFNQNSYIYDYSQKLSGVPISDYYGKKITAIGFNVDWQATTDGSFVPVCAIVDTSNYNLYLQENQDFSVTRKDTITTDVIFYSPTSKIKYPVHLAPNNIENIYTQELATNEYWDDVAYPILYSVGLGDEITNILEEHVIGDDISLNISNNKLLLENIAILEGISNSYLPTELPIYTKKSSYNYIIIKYKIYQRLNNSSTDTYEDIDTNYFYYQVLPVEKFGKKSLLIKYERS